MHCEDKELFFCSSYALIFLFETKRGAEHLKLHCGVKKRDVAFDELACTKKNFFFSSTELQCG